MNDLEIQYAALQSNLVTARANYGYWQDLLAQPRFKAALDEFDAGAERLKESAVRRDGKYSSDERKADISAMWARRDLIADMRAKADTVHIETAKRALEKFESENAIFLADLKAAAKEKKARAGRKGIESRSAQDARRKNGGDDPDVIDATAS